MFLFNMNVLVSKQTTLKTHTFLVKRGVATKRFFFNINLYFAKCEKLSFLGGGGPCLGKLWLMFKNTIK